ncbi:MAG: hypothetical protein IJ366_04495 [Clostridia bacterium]|nr:hypothetical protein [Clostridia bacterium]
MRKKLPIIAALSGVAVAAAYRIIKGHGVYNRLKFKDVHTAVSHYLETNHPGATCSAITNTGDGYYTIITDGTNKYMLTVTKTDDGMYVYHEDNLTISF